MSSIEIEYCVPCGRRHSAEQLQRQLLQVIEQDLDSLTLRMGSDCLLVVRVDDETVYKSNEDEGDMDWIVQDVVEAVKA